MRKGKVYKWRSVLFSALFTEFRAAVAHHFTYACVMKFVLFSAYTNNSARRPASLQLALFAHPLKPLPHTPTRRGEGGEGLGGGTNGQERQTIKTSTNHEEGNP